MNGVDVRVFIYTYDLLTIAALASLCICVPLAGEGETSGQPPPCKALCFFLCDYS